MVSSREVFRMADRLGRDPKNVLRVLRRTGYLLPLFKGYYYVRSPDELKLRFDRLNAFELFALAAEAKSVGHWYFGLDTALALNGLTHEDPPEAIVITDHLYRIRGVRIGNKRFRIHKWSPELTSFGIASKGKVRFSDPAKTVLDLAYLDWHRMNKKRPPPRAWVEHLPKIDKAALRRYSKHYPEPVRLMVEVEL